MADSIAVVGSHLVIVGSAGSMGGTPEGENPIFVDDTRYHGWMRALNAQGADVWTRRIEGGREIYIKAIAPVADGFVVAGEQRAGDVRAYTGWVGRYDANGQQRWRVDNLGEAGVTGLDAIAVNAKGDVIAGGSRGGKGWLLGFTANGTQRWEQRIANLETITAMTTLGDAIFGCGIVDRTTLHDGTSRLFALSEAGELRWSTALPERGLGELRAVVASSDGGIAVGQSDGGNERGAWVVRFSVDGSIRESRILDMKRAAAQTVALTRDGGFVVAGTVLEGLDGSHLAVWRFDHDGALRWEKAFSDNTNAASVTTTPDDMAVIVGSTRAPGAKLRPSVFAFDARGTQRWFAAWP